MKTLLIALLLASQGGVDSRTIHVRNKSGFTSYICVNGLTHTVQKGDSTKFESMPKLIDADLTYAYPAYNDQVLTGYPTKKALRHTDYFEITERQCDGTCNPARSKATSKISWSRVDAFTNETESCSWVCMTPSSLSQNEARNSSVTVAVRNADSNNLRGFHN